jgi:flavodoxin
MSALVICVSKEHGNTRRVADAIAEELGAEVVEPSQVTPEMIAAHDPIGFGSGIRYARPYPELLRLVERLPKQRDKRAFVFSTSGFGFRSWHLTLNRRLRARGFRIAGEFWCKGLDTLGLLRLFGGVNKGRPDKADLERARRFARGLS